MHRAASSSGERSPHVSRATTVPVAGRWLRSLAISVLVLLLIQFLAGMLVNFFVVLPDQHPGANAPEYFSGVVQGDWWALGHGGWELATHAGVGVLVGLASVVLLVLAILRRSRLWIIVTVLGFISVLAAGFNGASFLNYGHDFSSLLMTISFLLALIAYAMGIYYTKPA